MLVDADWTKEQRTIPTTAKGMVLYSSLTGIVSVLGAGAVVAAERVTGRTANEISTDERTKS
jgi:hypothetical protein